MRMANKSPLESKASDGLPSSILPSYFVVPCLVVSDHSPFFSVNKPTEPSLKARSESALYALASLVRMFFRRSVTLGLTPTNCPTQVTRLAPDVILRVSIKKPSARSVNSSSSSVSGLSMLKSFSRYSR